MFARSFQHAKRSATEAIAHGNDPGFRSGNDVARKKELSRRENGTAPSGRRDGTEKPAATGSAEGERTQPQEKVTIESAKNEAAEVVRRLVERFPSAADSMAVQAFQWRTVGKSEEALGCWRRCLELDPRSADACCGIGTALMDRGEQEEAVEWFTKA